MGNKCITHDVASDEIKQYSLVRSMSLKKIAYYHDINKTTIVFILVVISSGRNMFPIAVFMFIYDHES